MEEAILLLAAKWERKSNADILVDGSDLELIAKVEERRRMYQRCAQDLVDLVRLLGNEVSE